MAQAWRVEMQLDEMVLLRERTLCDITVDEQAHRMGINRADLYRALRDKLPEKSTKKKRFDQYVADRVFLWYEYTNPLCPPNNIVVEQRCVGFKVDKLGRPVL